MSLPPKLPSLNQRYFSPYPDGWKSPRAAWKPLDRPPAHNIDGSLREQGTSRAEILYCFGQACYKGDGDIRKNNEVAARHFKEASKQGYAPANLALIEMYLNGDTKLNRASVWSYLDSCEKRSGSLEDVLFEKYLSLEVTLAKEEAKTGSGELYKLPYLR